MRIIGGNKGGTRINIPKNLKFRPTTDRCKEALFNILNNKFDITTIEVLDLFCGSGNISYEFASRGSKKITSVDHNTKSLSFIRNFSKDQEFKITTIKSDVFKYLKRINSKFDIIFADPPYDFQDSQYISIINQIFKQNNLKSTGYLILEHSSKKNFNFHSNFYKSRKYSDSKLTFFKTIK